MAIHDRITNLADMTGGELAEQVRQLRDQLRKLSNERSSNGTLSDALTVYETDLAAAKTRQAQYLLTKEYFMRTNGRILIDPQFSAGDAFLVSDHKGDKTLLAAIKAHQYPKTAGQYEAERSEIQRQIAGLEQELKARDLQAAMELAHRKYGG